MAEKIIITCAVTGSAPTPDKNPAVPVTPEEIARSALEAHDAGAAIVHLHVRDPKTKLPVLAEGEFEVGKCLVTAFRKMHLKEVNGPIRWGVKINEKEFLPEIPEGFQSVEVPDEPLSERSIR